MTEIIDNNNNNNININTTLSTKNLMLQHMLQHQKKNLPFKLRLDLEDIKRILDNINTSIFDKDQCCIWNGYVTNNNEKCKYINFYFKHRKIALHRLLYINYVGSLDNKNYLKFTCKRKGICCNINHIEKCNLTTTTKEPITGAQIVQKTPGLRVMKLNESNNNDYAKQKFIVILSD